MRLGLNLSVSMGQLVLSLARKFYNLLAGEEAASNTNVFYDPADLTSLRVETDGSGGNPVVGDPVGIMMDTSQFGGKTAEAYLAGATELVTNGTFDSDISGWTASGATLSSESGRIRVANSGTNYGYAYQEIACEIGAVYQLQLNIYPNTSNATVRLGSNPAASANRVYNNTNVSSDETVNTTFQALTSTVYVRVGNESNTDGQYAEFDNISIKEIPGHHAIAPSDSARPVLFDDPDLTAAALTDDGTRGEELVNNSEIADWNINPVGSPTPDATVSGGVLTLYRTGGNYHRAYQNVTVEIGSLYEFTFTTDFAQSLTYRLGTGGLGGSEYASSTQEGPGTVTVQARAFESTMGVVFIPSDDGMINITSISIRKVNTVFDGQPNLVTNGTFDTDSDWTKGAGWSIGSGVASASSATGNLQQTGVATANKWYKIQFYISAYTSGTITANIGGTSGASYNSTGWKSDILRANGTPVNFIASSFTGSIDNVIVQELPASIDRKYYLDTDGSDDWMEVKPTLNLGEQWWHVGAWKYDTGTGRAFATSSDYRGALRSVLNRWFWYDSAGGNMYLSNSGPETKNVVTIEQSGTNSISARYNGVQEIETQTPYDDSGATQGFALFNSQNTSFNSGLDGRFYGGSWGQGQVDYDELTVLQDYLGTTTQPPIDPPDVTEYADVYELLSAQTGAVLFDIDDTTSLRVGRDGSGGVPVDGDPVGMMLDVSDTGGATVAAATAARPELVTNGTFDTDTSGWTSQNNATLAVVGGQLTVTGDGTSNPTAYQAITTVANEWYEVVGYHDHNGVFNTGIRIGTNAGGSEIADNLMTADGTYRFLFQATGTTTYVSLRNFTTATNTAVYDNISVKKISSHAAIAPSDSARPTLASVLDTTASELTDDGTRGEELCDLVTPAYITRPPAGGIPAAQTLVSQSNLEIGETYEINITGSSVVGSFSYRVAGSGSGVTVLSGPTNLTNGSQTVTVRIVRTGNLTINADADGFSATIESVSVKKVNTVFDERGPELVTNGWTLSTGWSVSVDGTALTQDGTGSGTSHAVKLDNVPAGSVEVSFDVSASTGCDLLDSAGVVSSNLSAGSYTFTISNPAQSANNLRFRPSGEAVVISNISVKEVLTPNLVTNGTFDTDSDWTKGTGWSIGSGVASRTGAGNSNLYTTNAISIVENRWYFVQFYVSAYTSGQVRPIVGTSGIGTNVSSTGWHSEYIRCSGSSYFFMQGLSFEGSIDNVSVQEVPASVARAHYLDFDGADDNLILDADTIAASSNATLYKTFRGDTTDTQQIMFAPDVGPYILAAQTGPATNLSSNVGSPVYREDGSIATYTDRPALFAALIDNTDHTIGVEEADLSAASDWTTEGFYIGGERDATYNSKGRLYAWAAVDTRLDGRGRDLLENFMIGKKTS